jgi:dTDP-glucose 4,6-dehydratase
MTPQPAPDRPDLPALPPEARELLEGRPVLVTGADGFVGSHLCDLLAGLRARLHVLVRAGSRGPQNLSRAVLEHARLHWGNLADPYSTRRVVSELAREPGGAPIVFHLAAQAHVGESWQRPVETFTDNALGTLNLLQALVDEKLELHRFDYAGTSEEFGNVDEERREQYTFRPDGTLVIDERTPLNPQSPYATSKVAADHLARNYHAAYGVPVVVTRMFNNFGPRQSPRYLTGTIITQALERPRVVMGNPEATRDYTYVLDGVRGHLYATLRGEPGHTYAFGFGEDLSNRRWAETILAVGREMGAWGERELAVDERRFRPGATELRRLGVDFASFRRATGWEPRTPREEGLRATIAWYREMRERWAGMVDWR